HTIRITVTPTAGLTTTEAAGPATFTIVLDSRPAANVTVPISSSNTAEGTVSVSSLTFTPANWNVARTITVTGVNDFVDDGDIAYTVVTGAANSADANYNAFDPADVALVNTDNDTSGFTIAPTAGLITSEAGATASFTVLLNSRPTANVTVFPYSTLFRSGTVGLASLTFTTANWNTPQTATL